MQTYFRLMILIRVKKLSRELGVGFRASKDELKHLKVIDITPRLMKDYLEVTIDAIETDSLLLAFN